MDILPQDNTPRKQCTGQCKQFLPATTEFFDRQKDGLRSQCKQCRKEERRSPEMQEYQRNYNKAYRDSHPELREQKRDYYNRPDIREKKRASDKAYYHHPDRHMQLLARVKAYGSYPENKARKSAYDKSYYNRSEVRERTRSRSHAWYHNPENHDRLRLQRESYYSRPEVHSRIIANARNHKARRKSVSGSYTPEQIQQLLKRQRYRCYYCAVKFVKRNDRHIYHIEHTFPLSRVVGTDIPANDISYIVLACPTCNASKHNKFPWEWPQGGRLL